MQILSVRGTLPEHRYAQAEITDAFAATSPGAASTSGCCAGSTRTPGCGRGTWRCRWRSTPGSTTSASSNDPFIEAAVELGAQALCRRAQGRRPHPAATSTSSSPPPSPGSPYPSLDARIAAVLGLRPDVKRVPLVGLGCVAGAAGVARLHDYLRRPPRRGRGAGLGRAVLADRAARRRLDAQPGRQRAVRRRRGRRGRGRRRARDARRAGGRVEVLGSRSRLYPDSERTMGWDVGATGLRIVLDADVPDLVRRYLGEDVDGFLADHGLTRADVEWWVCHPGGPKVLEAMRGRARLSPRGASSSPGTRSPGSATCPPPRCCTSSRTPCATGRRGPGSYGMLLAMGPGFCSELVLLRAPAEAAMTSLAVLHGPGRAGRPRAARRAGGLQAQRRLEPGATAASRPGGALPGDGGAAHRPAGRDARRGVGAPAGRAARARLVDARAGARLAGAALVVHRHARPALEHPRDRRARLPLVTGGPYRLLRHPNYVAVVVEGFALPLVHAAWVTALVFTVANAVAADACGCGSRTPRWPPRDRRARP